MKNICFLNSLFFVLLLTGCSSMAPSVRSYVDNAAKLPKDNSGVVYGVFAISDYSVNDMCKAIDYRDERCAESEKYVGVMVYSAFGFAAAGVVSVALEPKESPFLQYSKGCNRTGDRGCSYVKLHVKPGKFADILELASKPGDEKCYWSGMPRAGGVVCPAYHWDYRKDMHSWNTTNGVMSVSDK